MSRLWTIREASKEIQAGRLSPVELTHHCFEMFEAYERRVNAWVITSKERALAEADARARELKQGYYRGPLHGIPLGIKDIIDLFDWPTAAGSRLWSKSFARQDADCTHKLRQAGAVFLGKTVTTQYASFDPPPTRNPWKQTQTPGGSSSGSAAAVACGMCVASIGSQTGGSITRPAAYCGVASCKPSFGFSSTTGVLPLAPSMDHVGPMAHCVWDLALLMQTIAGASTHCLISHAEQGDCLPRVGVLRGMFAEMAHPAIKLAVANAERTLEKAGLRLEEIRLPPAMSEVLPRHRLVMAVEAAKYHEERLARSPEDYAPCFVALLKEGLSCPAPEYARCKEHQSELRSAMTELFSGHDAVLIPATTCPAPDAATTGDPAFNSPWSYTGFPSVSLPIDLTDDGLPVSIQLVGRPETEPALLAAAAWVESKLGWMPKLPPH